MGVAPHCIFAAPSAVYFVQWFSDIISRDTRKHQATVGFALLRDFEGPGSGVYIRWRDQLGPRYFVSDVLTGLLGRR